MGFVEKRSERRWRARVRVSGHERSRTFRTKTAGDRWVREIEDQLERGDLVDPARGRTTIGEWWEQWMLNRAPSLRASTVARDESYWRSMIGPVWGTVQLRHVEHGEAARWVLQLSEDGRAPRTVEKRPIGSSPRAWMPPCSPGSLPPTERRA